MTRYLSPLFSATEQGFFHLRMHHGQVLLSSELAELARGEDAEDLGWVHGSHVPELSEAVVAKLRGVEEGGEGPLDVESFVLESVEDLAGDVGLQCVLGVAGVHVGDGEVVGAGGRVVRGAVIDDGAGRSCNVPAGGAH